MKIMLNGAWREIANGLASGGDAAGDTARELADGTQGSNLDTLLRQLGLGEAVVATAVNGEFVPVAARARARLRDGDRVEVLAPMQGG